MIFSEDEVKKKIVLQCVEIYQCMSNGRYKRIASLPNADDALLNYMNERYKKPFFRVRVKTVLF